MFARGNFTWGGGGMVRMAHLRPPLVEHWNTQNWSLVKMLPTNNLERIGRQLILLDKTLSGKYGENEAIRNLQKSLSCTVFAS